MARRETVKRWATVRTAVSSEPENILESIARVVQELAIPEAIRNTRAALVAMAEERSNRYMRSPKVTGVGRRGTTVPRPRPRSPGPRTTLQ